MQKIKVAINGFGRIGRVFLRAAINRPNIQIVAINDLTDTKTLAHLLKYDSVHGKFDGTVAIDGDNLIINNQKIRVAASADPAKLPWKELDVDVVVESTGHYLNKESAQKHIAAGAKKVLISAPPTDADIKTIVLGVNDNTLSKNDTIISNASCTTNCAAPMIKVLLKWGIEDVYISTVHSYTGDQRLHDAPHKDLRRARAAALNIVPTSTGAAKATTKIFPQLEGKVGGCGIRVPVPDGSLTDITCILERHAEAKEINAEFKRAAQAELKGILEYTEDPIVSSDIVGNPHSCILDAEFTAVVGNMVKVIGWYDNEGGYSNRLADVIEKWFSL